jgi:hypothetical protein
MEVFTPANEREASLSERGKGFLAWSGPQTELLEGPPEKESNGRTDDKHAIETVRSVPRSSTLTSASM